MTDIEIEWTVNPVIPMMAQLTECVCAHVELAGSGPVCWCGIYPGASVSWDSCGVECDDPDTCGMAYVRPATSFPYESFPFPALDDTCQAPVGFEVEIGILRCFPTAEEDGSLPSPEVITSTAIDVLQDQWALHKAIRCCEFEEGKVVLGQWTPVGPQGGCVGGHWSAFLNPYRWA